jgi:hypothetical protein
MKLIQRTVGGGALLGASLLLAGTANAAELNNSALRRAVPDGEFRGSLMSRRGNYENHVWRFMPDGTIQTVLMRFRVYKANSGTEHKDLGRWWIENNRLCIHWNELMLAKVSCYNVRQQMGIGVHLSGPDNIEGTLTPRR